MKLTPRGIPYVEASDPIDQTAATLQDLAETLDDLVLAYRNAKGNP